MPRITPDDHSALSRPAPRHDSARPATAPGRRVARTPPEDQRRPYPTAATLTRASRPRSPQTSARTPRHQRPPQPIPATVWTSGTDPIDPTQIWPVPIIATIVGSFSRPGAHVVLVPWPAVAGGFSSTDLVGPGGVINHAPDTLPAGELATAVDAVERLDRSTTVIQLPTRVHGESGSRPFWADLLPGSHRLTADGYSPGAVGPGPQASETTREDVDAAAGSADLIITSLPVDPATPEGGDPFRDHVALAAARLLRVGGILAVLTHSDWSDGRLIDPTGPIVAAAQNADLLYLQHIVALHTPIRDGQLISTPAATGEAGHTGTDRPAAQIGSPAPHRRASSDVIVFAQAHDHQFPPLPAATAATTRGVIR